MKDINLIGGFYKSKTLPWSAQDVVNWAPVPSRSGGTRSPLKLRGLPGLRAFFVTVDVPSDALTSKLYPVEAVERMSSAGNAIGSQLLAVYIEAMDSAAAVTGGELRALLIGYEMQSEAIDSAASLTAGELKNTLFTYVMQSEAIDSAAAIAAGELRTILINYQNYQYESLDSAAAITGGALA